MLSLLSSQLRFITWSVFLTLLFLAVCLPTGSIFGINVKVMAVALFVPMFLFCLATSRNLVSRGDAFLWVAVLTALCFWSLTAVANQTQTNEIFSQLRDLGSAIFIAWLCIFSVRRGLVKAERLIAVIIWGTFSLAVLKLVIIARSLLFGIDPLQTMVSIFGEGSTTIGEIGYGLMRLQFSGDILGSFVLFALLAPSISGIKFRPIATVMVSIVVLLSSGFLAYSRYVWFIFVACIFVALILEKKWKRIAAILVTVSLLSIPLYGPLTAIFESRFLSAGTDISDEGRIAQAKALSDEIESRPVFGKGIGAHSNLEIRSDVHMYSYEMQWLSLLMQFGVVGELGIFLLIVASAWDLLKTRHPAKLWVGLLFVLWLLASWTNPYLTSSFAGAVFGLFMVMFYRMRTVATKETLGFVESVSG